MKYCIKSSKQNLWILSISQLIIAFFSLFLKINFFPHRFFVDSTQVLRLSNGENIPATMGYSLAGNLFKNINILGFSTITEWSIMLGMVFSIVCAFMYLKFPVYKGYHVLFVLISFSTLNIFIFTIGKDIIQFSVFFIIAVITNIKKMKYRSKLCTIIGLLFLCGKFFRPYYFIVLSLLLLFSVVDNSIKEGRKKITLIVGSIFVFLIVIKYANYSLFVELTNVRYTTNIHPDVRTQINNLIEGKDSVIVFFANYIINFFRICMPIELLKTINITYFCFFIYQTIFIMSLIIGIKNKSVNKEFRLLVILLFAYFLTSVLFEPDFGSVIRHESALFPVILCVLHYEENTYCNSYSCANKKGAINENYSNG